MALNWRNRPILKQRRIQQVNHYANETAGRSGCSGCVFPCILGNTYTLYLSITPYAEIFPACPGTTTSDQWSNVRQKPHLPMPHWTSNIKTAWYCCGLQSACNRKLQPNKFIFVRDTVLSVLCQLSYAKLIHYMYLYFRRTKSWDNQKIMRQNNTCKLEVEPIPILILVRCSARWSAATASTVF